MLEVWTRLVKISCEPSIFLAPVTSLLSEVGVHRVKPNRPRCRPTPVPDTSPLVTDGAWEVHAGWDFASLTWQIQGRELSYRPSPTTNRPLYLRKIPTAVPEEGLGVRCTIRDRSIFTRVERTAGPSLWTPGTPDPVESSPGFGRRGGRGVCTHLPNLHQVSLFYPTWSTARGKLLGGEEAKTLTEVSWRLPAVCAPAGTRP